METEIAIRNHEIPHLWSEEVLSETDLIEPEVNEADKKGRKDLRNKYFVTIDGEDARDFDDAVYCEPKPAGGWRLWVAIADVAHYVKPGSTLDREAPACVARNRSLSRSNPVAATATRSAALSWKWR